MRWIPNVVRSLGWDPGHHEEVRNSPENKIHIWEVIFRVTRKVQDFHIVPKVLEGSGGYHSGAHLSRTTNMDRRGLHRPTWARHTSPPCPMRLDQVDKIKSLENRDLINLGGKVAPPFWSTLGLGGGAKAAPHAYIRGRGGLARRTTSPKP